MLAVIDIGKKPIPCGYLIFCIPHRAVASLKPSVNTISASSAMLSFIVLARLDRLSPRPDYARKVVRMNNVVAAPVFQLLLCLAEILLGLAVVKFHLAHCTRRMHVPGNIVDDLQPGELA